jgi:hypothetical protein
LVEVLRIQNRAAYALDDVRGLVLRAFEAVPALPDGETVLAELERLADLEALIVLIAREEGDLKGLAILTAPLTRLTAALAVYHFYVEGGGSVRQALAREVVAWTRDLGLPVFETVNLNGQDRAFERLFASEAKAEKAGSLFRFEVGA